jgi:predicted pyridoxine 5'-phosphate oxidase superfamily flavin-nucleotide-binding protein
MTLDDARIQRFLATKEVAVLATVQPDGAPLAMAMWFLHDPAALTMISVDGLPKVRNLRRDPRVSVVAEAGSRRGLSRQIPAPLRAVGRTGHAGQSRHVQDRAGADQELGPHLRAGARPMPSTSVLVESGNASSRTGLGWASTGRLGQAMGASVGP